MKRPYDHLFAPLAAVTMSFTWCLLSAMVLGLALMGCKARIQPSRPPGHSVALVAPVRGAIMVRAPGSDRSMQVGTDHRVEQGSLLSTGPGARATLALDSGGWLLMDASTRLRVTAKGARLVGGRVWVVARSSGVTITTRDGSVSGSDAGFDVQVLPGSTRVYCGSAEVSVQASKQTLRLVNGMMATVKDHKIVPELQKVWDDWTGGMALASSPDQGLAPGVGSLEARMQSERGLARSPLLVRDHRVKVVLDGDLAVTTVEQRFFNPRSKVVEGRYRVRLPKGAIIRSFAAGKKGNVLTGEVVARSRADAKPEDLTVLEWEAPDRYVATIYPIGPGDTTVVRLEYVQWLHRKGGRRRYVYPMGAGRAPKLGELAIEVNVKNAGAKGLEAGMGAKREGDWVIVRRSDFLPRASFVLELLDGAEKRRRPMLRHAAGASAKEPSYVALSLLSPFPRLPKAGTRAPMRIVLVADVSAGMEASDAALVRTVADAIMRQLTPDDQVALMVASVDARPLGRGLARATARYKEELLGGLGKARPGGGTDLEEALKAAARLLPRGMGSVVYIGDGRATMGTLAPGLLRDRLARRLPPPRIFAVGIGADAAMDLLDAVTDELGFATGVRSPFDAPRAALRVVAHAARPTLRDVTVDLGPSVDRVYPRRPVTVEEGTFLHVLGRLRGKLPREVTLRGLRGGRPFQVRLPLAHQKVSDRGDLRRRWAVARVQDLLRRGAGREAVAEVGVRYSIVTPFSGVVVGAPGRKHYSSRLPADPAGTFVPESLRGAPPASGITIALEPGWSTIPSRVIPLADMYRRALHRKLWAAARASFDRKAASRPDLSGEIPIRLEVNPDGTVFRAELVKDAVVLKDPDVVEDVLRLVRSVQLPPTPTGERLELTHRFIFLPEDISDVPRRCLAPDGTRKRSKESYRYLEARRALWRERIRRNPSAAGAHKVWREALACGEIRLDTDARALLRLAMGELGTTAIRVDLYQRMRRELPWVREFLRREILRRVRSAQDVRAVRGGLALDGGVDQGLLARMLKRARTDLAKLEVVRRFLTLAPRSISLRVRLMHLLERAGKPAEAERVAWELRGEPASDAGVRQQVGELFLRRGNRAEARRAFSELVEYAPYDPWARRRLGDLFLAQAASGSGKKGNDAWVARLYGDAYREYETLAWLLPGDSSVMLLMANAAEGMGRLDWALRLRQRVSEAAEVGQRGSTPAAWARLLISAALARMRSQTTDSKLLRRLRSRGRRAGIHAWAKDLALVLTWSHPDARLQLWMRPPGAQTLSRVETRGGAVGVEGIRLSHMALWGRGAAPAPRDRRSRRDLASAPVYLEVRCPDPSLDRVGSYEGELLLLWKESRPGERVRRVSLRFGPRTRALAFQLDPKGGLKPTAVEKPRKKKRER